MPVWTGLVLPTKRYHLTLPCFCHAALRQRSDAKLVVSEKDKAVLKRMRGGDSMAAASQAQEQQPRKRTKQKGVNPLAMKKKGRKAE